MPQLKMVHSLDLTFSRLTAHFVSQPSYSAQLKPTQTSQKIVSFLLEQIALLIEIFDVIEIYKI